MFFTKKIQVEIIEKINSTYHKAVCRDYEAEDRAMEELSDKYWGRESKYNDRYDKWDREDCLYKYASMHWDVYVKKDDWTNETILLSEQSWYEHTMKVRYCFNDTIFEKKITINSARSSIRNVYVSFKKRDPDNIIEVTYD